MWQLWVLELPHLIFLISALLQVRVNAGGTVVETTRATLSVQPHSALARRVAGGEHEIFLDVCPRVGRRLLFSYYSSCLSPGF